MRRDRVGCERHSARNCREHSAQRGRSKLVQHRLSEIFTKEVRMNIVRSSLAIAAAILLSACSGMTSTEKGTIAGAAVGGVAGSALTGGSALGTVGGAAAGGIIG